MKILSKITLGTILLGSTLLASNQTYLGVSLGYSDLNVDQTDKVGSIILGNKIEENGYSANIEAGYKYSDKVDISVNYQRSVFDDTYLNNFYISSNYKLDEYNGFIPYLGVNLGYSELHWDKKPINTINNDHTSSSYFYGGNLGVIKPLTSKIDLDVKYQINVMDHDTSLEVSPAKSELEHNLMQSLMVGIRYNF